MRNIFKCYIHVTYMLQTYNQTKWKHSAIFQLFFQAYQFSVNLRSNKNTIIFVSKYFSFPVDDKIAEFIKRTNTFAIPMTRATFQLFGEIVDIVEWNVATDCVQKIGL